MSSPQTGARFTPDQDKIQTVLDYKKKMGDDFPKYAVFIVAYNAMEKLVQVLERIPDPIYDILTEIYIFDDFSPDQTFEHCQAYLDQNELDKVSLYQNPRNYGYGGNQKLGYEYALAKGYDYVVLLHGDGQYAPEYLPDMVLPTLEDDAQVVFGSRMMRPKEAIKGGMPYYKFLGNRTLTIYENFMLKMDLTEYHSGYRLYGTRLLSKINFKFNTDDFHFDTQIIIQCKAAHEKITEVPIPTYYGDEICHVNGMKYAADVAISIIDYRLHLIGITRKERYIPVREQHYELKDFPFSSHSQIVDLVPENSNVLDLGCGHGMLAPMLKEKGCSVTGVDLLAPDQVLKDLDRYVQADIQDPDLPFGREFDCIVLGDVIEHLSEPEKLMGQTRKFLKENGILIMCVPNIALWIYRISLMAGRFEYTDKGIMDRGHLKFFTQVTARYLLWSSGFKILEERSVPIPFQLVISMESLEKAVDIIGGVYQKLASFWPRMFAYQLIFKAQISGLEWDELQKIPIDVETPHPHLKEKQSSLLN